MSSSLYRSLAYYRLMRLSTQARASDLSLFPPHTATTSVDCVSHSSIAASYPLSKPSVRGNNLRRIASSLPPDHSFPSSRNRRPRIHSLPARRNTPRPQTAHSESHTGHRILGRLLSRNLANSIACATCGFVCASCNTLRCCCRYRPLNSRRQHRGVKSSGTRCGSGHRPGLLHAARRLSIGHGAVHLCLV